jgi:hypothetical protein
MMTSGDHDGGGLPLPRRFVRFSPAKLRQCPKFINHKGHEVTQRCESSEGFLRAPLCPLWLIMALPKQRYA